jgi:hypothetical protein
MKLTLPVSPCSHGAAAIAKPKGATMTTEQAEQNYIAEHLAAALWVTK